MECSATDRCARLASLDFTLYAMSVIAASARPNPMSSSSPRTCKINKIKSIMAPLPTKYSSALMKLAGSMMNAFSEGLILADKSGLNPKTLLDVLDLGAIANPMFKMKGPTVNRKSYSPAFPLKHQQKDMRLALAFGDQNAVSMPVAVAANEEDIELVQSLGEYVAKKKGKTIFEEIGSDKEMPFQETSQTDKGSNDDVESTSSANEYRKSTKESKRKTPTKDTNNYDKGENKNDCTTPKKAKVVWTNAIHNQFLEAIRSTGLERAIPKKILELMNVPGLTRENVASHLQKYRIFLKRVSEASYKIQSANERNMVERTFRLTFASGRPSSSMFNRSQLSNNLNLKPKPNGNSYKNNYAGYQMAGDGRLVGLGFKDGEASTNYNSNNFLMNGKQNNESMITMPLLSGNFGDHLAQGVITSNGFQSQGQVSPTTFNHDIQQENNSVIPMPPTPFVQQNSFGNGRGESDRFFGLLNNVSDFDSNSFLQPFGEDDLSFNFLNQINIQSPTQQDDEEFLKSVFASDEFDWDDNHG
ncbi:Glyoxylate/succinic semialdehyde reductase 1 [Camellia lanceoleosa]|uniref:Glyoxylate/succinic semialdehyde reductase 1 n=1 Tax=Camellia lanceoleosa TaxID=1840588 RepID=A0ACC0J391_9ERIC|nr:Glyoxylate/succinic semialdehyde reductase 1 [Camellia lanceoleosa]